MLTEELWVRFTAHDGLRSSVPEWVVDLFKMPFTEIQKLPSAKETIYDGGTTDSLFRPNLELKEVTPSYLTFLRGQIQIGARGEEWTNVLSNRLQAIAPYEKKKLYSLFLLRVREGCSESVMIRLDPETLELIHVEV